MRSRENAAESSFGARRERASSRAGITVPGFEPRAINMGRRIADDDEDEEDDEDDEDDDDGYVPRFRLAPLLFSTRRVAHVACIQPAEKLAVRPVTSGCRL
jgi:hypothetical protein